MRIEHIVVNASPLICLFKSGLSDILPSLFSEIMVPDKVHEEITAKSGIDLSSIKQLKLGRDIVILPSIASWDIGEGKSSVISFALKNPDYWAVIDDREARRCAMSLGCRHMGTIGIILLAKRRGIIPSVRESLHKLHTAGL